MTTHGPIYHLVNRELKNIYFSTKCSAEEAVDRNASFLYIMNQIKKLEPVWISVEERLPEKHIGGGAIDVLTCDTEGNVIMNCYFQDQDFPEEGEWTESDGDITHWMPLPNHPLYGNT